MHVQSNPCLKCKTRSRPFHNGSNEYTLKYEEKHIFYPLIGRQEFNQNEVNFIIQKLNLHYIIKITILAIGYMIVLST